MSSADLRAASGLECTADPSRIASADFSPLASSSTTVGKNMKRGAVVVYESTVYPGATEEICIPVLEKHSGMKWQTDFHIGYSPERINPGDKEHTLTKILKVVSGDDAPTLDWVAKLYEARIQHQGGRSRQMRISRQRDR